MAATLVDNNDLKFLNGHIKESNFVHSTPILGKRKEAPSWDLLQSDPVLLKLIPDEQAVQVTKVINDIPNDACSQNVGNNTVNPTSTSICLEEVMNTPCTDLDKSDEHQLNEKKKRVKKIVSETEVKPWNIYTPDEAALKKRKEERTFLDGEPIRPPKEEKFRDILDVLEEYGIAHGTCNAPRGMMCKLPDGSLIGLGAWVHNMRKDQKTGRIARHRLYYLQKLVDKGLLCWTMEKFNIGLLLTTDDDAWEEKFGLMLKYGDEHGGDCNVPRPYICVGKDGYEITLGVWLLKQKARKESGILRQDRFERLQALVDAGRFKWGVPRRKYGQDKKRKNENNGVSSAESDGV